MNKHGICERSGAAARCLIALGGMALALVLSLSPVFAGSAWAKGEAPDGNVYTYEVNSGKATITGVATETTTDYVIPETLDGFTVNAIGRYCFKTNETMTSIDLPSTVTTLGDQAFAGATALQKVKLPEGYVGALGDSLFWGCEALEDIYLPEGVTAIGGWCFYNCISLRSINIPSTCMNIDKYAFNLDAEKESSLEEVIFPADDVSSLTSLGNYAFKHCTKLRELNLPSTVRSLGIEAIRGCTSLETLTLPAGIVTLPICCLKGCTSLKTLYVYGNITSMSKNAIGMNDSLESVYFLGDISNMTFLDKPFERLYNTTFYAYPQYSGALQAYVDELNASTDEGEDLYHAQVKDINEVIDQIAAAKGGSNEASYTVSSSNAAGQSSSNQMKLSLGSMGSVSVYLLVGIMAFFIVMEAATIILMRRRCTQAVEQALDAERLKLRLEYESAKRHE